MITFPASAKTAGDGTLSLAIPTGLPDTDVDVVVVVERAGVDASPATVSWPAGFFETHFGALKGIDFERPAQGDLPERLPFA